MQKYKKTEIFPFFQENSALKQQVNNLVKQVDVSNTNTGTTVTAKCSNTGFATKCVNSVCFESQKKKKKKKKLTPQTCLSYRALVFRTKPAEQQILWATCALVVTLIKPAITPIITI